MISDQLGTLADRVLACATRGAAPTPELVAPAIGAITEQGIYTIPERLYHADPVAVPSLSRSIARLLIDASPAHAYAAHPRLGAGVSDTASDSDEAMDIGTAVHALFLEGRDRIARITHDSYRSNDAKAARDAAIKAGKIPLKAKAYDAAMRVVERLERFRATTGLFTEGRPEQTVVWQDTDHWARCRIDWLPDDPAAHILDLKTTGALATIDGWTRNCFAFGADLQAAMYPRGVEHVRGEPPGGMLFVVVETDPPYALRTFELDPIALRIGHSKATAARAIWTACMQTDRWPEYPETIERILPPAWVVRQWEQTL